MPEQPTQGKPDDVAKLTKRLADLELQVATQKAAMPLGTVPEHSGGISDEIAETWSLYDQGLAAAGTHPDQEEDDHPAHGLK
jgi:uncharacterized coiled-coil protein SlyX